MFCGTKKTGEANHTYSQKAWAYDRGLRGESSRPISTLRCRADWIWSALPVGLSTPEMSEFGGSSGQEKNVLRFDSHLSKSKHFVVSVPIFGEG